MEEPAPPPFVTGFLLLLIAASLSAWIRLIGKWRRGEPLLEHRPHAPVVWGGSEVIALICSIFIFQLAARQVTLGFYGIPFEAQPDEIPGHVLATMLAGNGVAMLMVVAVGVALFAWHGARSLADFGLSLAPKTLLSDLRLAAGAFIVALLPVYTLQFILMQWMPQQHVVLEMIRDQPDPLLLIAAGFTVVIAAPLAEEFVFRLALQGWLERREQSRFAALRPPNASAPAGNPESEAAVTLPPPTSAHAEDHQAAETSALGRVQGLVPVLVSSLIFALLHAGSGAAPISLFPLALILGYLYLRTGRLLPCVFMHAIFNGFNLLLLVLSL